MIRKLVLLAALGAILTLPSKGLAQPADAALLDMPFDQIEEQARGSQVRWYMFGGWAHVNDWVDSYVAGEMKKRWGIDLVRVPMDAGVFVNKLLNEKAAGKRTGTIDLLWINGENFKNAKEAGLLFGPFAANLPNVQRYVDPKSVAYDFGYPVDGYEAPYGRAQFVFETDTARIDTPPQTMAALKAWVKANPGRFTYPQPPDFTGSAFIRQVFCAVTGGHEQYLAGWNPDLFARKAPLLWNWLNDIEPFLWQKGRTYPKDSAVLDTLFSRGEVAFGMSYHPPHAQNKILEGSYPETVRTFVLKDGSIYNTHFTAIPFNSPNKAGAMVLANFLISVDAQLSKYDPENWGDFPALDPDRLTPAQRNQFQSVDLGPATLGSDQLDPVAVPEIPSAYLEALEQGWKTHVLDN
ncbi:ABC transporter substrate-binding protein [Desulfosarcina widdelii]|uniref:ABC transporter substrate-binding protein n=1 Tax=Desulfosarcina widdelii TaxID=947919 RepID=A0A5K7Z727_9BACT|nr:ABC transporter substrate-binding protein [Desulfosarcina widdelii]BBO77616.1 ABC transporter substrate-binding protein [Desulfosarcina widdelii]